MPTSRMPQGQPTPSSPPKRFLLTALAQGRALGRRAESYLIVRRRSQMVLVVIVSGLIALGLGLENDSPSGRAGAQECPSARGLHPAPIPPGWRGVALPRDLVTPPVAPGATVDLVAAGETLAPGALVVTAPSPDSGAVIAVPAHLAPRVADAVLAGVTSIVSAPDSTEN